jgi:hypothetical protein
MTPKAGGAPQTMTVRVTTGVKKINGKWLYVVDHASVPAGPPPGEVSDPTPTAVGPDFSRTIGRTTVRPYCGTPSIPLSRSQSARRCGQVWTDVKFERCAMLNPCPPFDPRRDDNHAGPCGLVGRREVDLDGRM